MYKCQQTSANLFLIMKMVSNYQNKHKNGTKPTSETEIIWVISSKITFKGFSKYLHIYLKHVANLHLVTQYCRWHHISITPLKAVIFYNEVLWLFNRASHISSEIITKTLSIPHQPYTLNYNLEDAYVPIKSDYNYHHYFETRTATIDNQHINKIMKMDTQNQ